MRLNVKMPYQGKNYRVRLEYTRTHGYREQKPEFRFKNGAIVLSIPVNGAVYRESLLEAIQAFYEERVRGQLKERVLNIGRHFDVYCFDVAVTELENGWTGHDYEGRILIDWRLLLHNDTHIDLAIAKEILLLKNMYSTSDEEKEKQMQEQTWFSDINVTETYAELHNAWQHTLELPEKIAREINRQLSRYNPKEMNLYVLRNEEKGYVNIQDKQLHYVEEAFQGSLFADLEEAKTTSDQLVHEGVFDVVKMNTFVGESLYRNKEDE